MAQKYNPEYRRTRYLKDREKIIAWQKEYDEAHKERRRVLAKNRYRKKCGLKPLEVPE